MAFSNLDVKNPLFIELQNNPPAWWLSLLNDKDIIIEIRKDNYIDIYYNGGAIVKELKKTKAGFSGTIHYKYIPYASKKDYVPYQFSGNNTIDLDKSKLVIQSINNFNANILKIIKENIKKHYPNDSEKGIQSNFIKNDPYYIDSEFAYNCPQNGETRIDLVRIDTKEKKIVFIEVKKMGDKRLYNKEIVNQLEKYQDFISHYKTNLLSYYTLLFEIKKNLNLLPTGLVNIKNLNGYAIADKPLLLFGDCEQEWINNFSSVLDNKIKQYALGCYYFGKPEYSSDLIAKTSRNRHIF